MLVQLPLSKSVAARELLLEHVLHSNATHRYQQYQDAFGVDLPLDVKVLGEALQVLETTEPNKEVELECHESGTALRFLITLAAVGERVVTLRMVPRLMERPWESLAEVYEELGATFERVGETLRITPVQNRYFAELIEASSWQSSQFASALLLTAPLMEWDTLQVFVPPSSPSHSYFSLTCQLLRKRGIDVRENNHRYFIKSVAEKKYNPSIERDWSSAAYFYQLLALSPNLGSITMPELALDSSQPDVALARVYQCFGIETVEGVTIQAVRSPDEAAFIFDFSQNIDLFPSLTLTCIGLRVPFRFTGLEALVHKESNRLRAVVGGLRLLGVRGLREGKNELQWDGSAPTELHKGGTIDCHNDHRITMAFAVLSVAQRLQLRFSHPESVTKSFPSFWAQLL